MEQLTVGELFFLVIDRTGSLIALISTTCTNSYILTVKRNNFSVFFVSFSQRIPCQGKGRIHTEMGSPRTGKLTCTSLFKILVNCFDPCNIPSHVKRVNMWINTCECYDKTSYNTCFKTWIKKWKHITLLKWTCRYSSSLLHIY